MALILPGEAENNAAVQNFVSSATRPEGAIREAHHFDLRQSMRNGGGPACLRLRVVLTEDELAAIGNRGLVDEPRIDALEAIVRRRYRDQLSVRDLADPSLLDESRAALDEIGQVLGLGPVHDFQRI
jgi:succinylarginine dihydrolase